ncbi:MAG: T9SS type A sorting domain-containing protein [Bacteroidota bacterium]
MNKKTTLLLVQFFFILMFASEVHAQQIYTNGNFSTGVVSNSGVAAPSGYTWSECQNNIGNTTEANTSSGFSSAFNVNGNVNNVLADDFIVPAGAGWSVTSFDFYGYEVNSTATTLPFDELRIQIYNGDPSAGGTVIAGNLTTNVLDVANSGEAFIYRIFNSTVPAPSPPTTLRKVWRLRGNLPLSLSPGTYWVAFQMHPINDLGCFSPPVTVVGTRGLASWNAKQSTVDVPAFTGIFDDGNPVSAPDVNQDLPFVINGTLGISQHDFESGVLLFPNPVKDLLFITVPEDVTVTSYEIFDLNGKIVKYLNSDTSGILEINVSEFSDENYTLKLKSNKGIVTKKFIKK